MKDAKDISYAEVQELQHDGKLREQSTDWLKQLADRFPTWNQHRLSGSEELWGEVRRLIKEKQAAEAERQSEAVSRQRHDQATALKREEIEESRQANRIAKRALWVSGVALVVSIVALLREKPSTAPAAVPAPLSPSTNAPKAQP